MLNTEAKCKLLRFSSKDENAELYIKASEGLGLDGILVTFIVAGREFTARIPVMGVHNIRNAAYAVLGSLALFPELSAENIRKGLEEFSAPLLRSRLRLLRNSSKVIDESYECSAPSLLAWIGVAEDLRRDGARVALILGLVAEQAAVDAAFVDELRRRILKLKPDFLIVLGNVLTRAFERLPESENLVVFAAETNIAAAHIATKLNFDILLVKGSQQLELQHTVEILIERLGE